MTTGADPTQDELVHKFSDRFDNQDVVRQPLVWRKALFVQYEELWEWSDDREKEKKSHLIRKKINKTKQEYINNDTPVTESKSEPSLRLKYWC